jgi:glycogen debranching enzyme
MKRSRCLDDDTRRDAEVVLKLAQLTYRGAVVGTVAARDPHFEIANYGECFVRDFAVTAAAWLETGRVAPVADFLTTLAHVQARASDDGGLKPAPGLMPASFSVHREGEESLVADFGQRAIGRVVPVDSALWWIVVLLAYTRRTGDLALARSDAVRAAIERILALYLQPQFEMLPSLLVPDGSSMIDRRMGIAGHPLDVQVLFWAALRASRKLLPFDHPLQERVHERLVALGHHLRSDYWIDRKRIEAVRRLPVEEFGPNPSNPWNLHPDAIPVWTMAWLSEGGGYFAGNVGPARLDVRFYAQGNLLAVTTGLATDAQTEALVDLLERHESDLLGAGGMKLLFPPLEREEWSTVTGSDHKNVPWSYHNAGSWPMLLWPLAAAAKRAGRADLARRAVARSRERLRSDGWPEYYDGPTGGLIGRQARLQQTWTAAALLAAGTLLDEPDLDDPFTFERDDELERAIEAAKPIPWRTGATSDDEVGSAEGEGQTLSTL